jgi:hypothetical protein
MGHNPNPSSALACQLSPAADFPKHSLWAALVESRMGAVAWAVRQRSVSHPRSSDRTCGFPAYGSSTGFIVRRTERVTKVGVRGAAPPVPHRQRCKRTGWQFHRAWAGTLPKVGRHAQFIPADSDGRSDRPLTSAVRLIHRPRLSCRRRTSRGVQRRYHSSLRGHRGYAIFQSNGLSIGRRGVADAMGLTRTRRTTIAIYRRF